MTWGNDPVVEPAKPAWGASDPELPPSLARGEEDKARMLPFARKRLERGLPNVQAVAAGLGSSVVAPVARALGADETADRLNRFGAAYEQAAQERDQQGIVPPILMRGLRGAAKTLPTAIVTSHVAGPYGAIGTAALQERDQAITEARDMGLSEPEVKRYAAVQGIVEGSVAAAFQKIGLGGLESTVTRRAASKGLVQALKQAGKDTLQELPEEIITELGHSVTRAVVAGDQAALSPEELQQVVADTTVQTLITLGAAEAPNIGQTALAGRQRAQRLAQLKELRAAKPFISAEDAQTAGIPGETRKERLSNTDSEIKQLEKEVQDASTVSGPEAEVRQPEGGEDLRGQGQVEVPAEPAGEVAPEASKVPVDQDLMAAILAAEKAAPEEVLAQGPAEFVPSDKLDYRGEVGSEQLPATEQPKKSGRKPPESLPAAPKPELAPEPTPAVPVTPAASQEAEKPVKRRGRKDEAVRPPKPDGQGIMHPAWDNSVKAWVSKTNENMIWDTKANGWRLKEPAEGYKPTSEKRPVRKVQPQAEAIQAPVQPKEPEAKPEPIPAKPAEEKKAPETSGSIALTEQDEYDLSKLSDAALRHLSRKNAGTQSYVDSGDNIKVAVQKELGNRKLADYTKGPEGVGEEEYKAWSKAREAKDAAEQSVPDEQNKLKQLEQKLFRTAAHNLKIPLGRGRHGFSAAKQYDKAIQNADAIVAASPEVAEQWKKIKQAEQNEKDTNEARRKAEDEYYRVSGQGFPPVPPGKRFSLDSKGGGMEITVHEFDPKRGKYRIDSHGNESWVAPQPLLDNYVSREEQDAVLLAEKTFKEAKQAKEAKKRAVAEKEAAENERVRLKEARSSARTQPDEKHTAVAKTKVKADKVLDSFDLGKHKSGERFRLSSHGLAMVKEMAKVAPEFAYEPVFTVNAKKQLVFRDGVTYTLNPESFNLHPSELTEGQTVGINLEDIGLKQISASEAVARSLKNAGFSNVRETDGGVSASWGGKEVSLKGKDDKWFVEQLTGQGPTMAQQVLSKMHFMEGGKGFQAKPTESAAEEAQRKSEEARGKSQASGYAGGGTLSTERIRDDEIPDVIKAPDEQEKRLQKARGMQKPSLLARIKEGLTHLKNVTRAQEHLPNTKDFASANEFFRLLKNVPAMASDEAVRTTAAVVDPLGPKQLYLFERYAVIQNLAASIKLGQPLRFGFKSAQDVEAYRAKIQEVVDQVPAVKEAIETRKKIVQETVDKLVGYELLPESALENAETYYHQQVHFYMLARMNGGGTRAGKTGRSFQRARVEGEALTSEEMDYNTSYLESEISWLTDATMEIEKERLLRQLMDKYDIKSDLQKKAGKGKRWQDFVPETHEVFQPEPGNNFYRAFTLPEKIVEQLQGNVLETAELSAEDLRQVLALAGPKRQFVVPSEIAAQLAATRKGEAQHGLALIADEAMRMWKAWTLLNPKRALTYNLRNITGDLDPVVAADPSLLRQTGRALQELANYHKGRLQISPELRAARDLGVIGSGFTAEEVPDIKDLAVFRRFIGTSGRSKFHPLSVIQGYMDIIKPFTNWREDALRYAAFLGYRDQLRQGRVKHYGGAKKAVVDQIKKDLGVDAAAAHLARNLLGDYGNISVAGNWIRRRLAPFWSFQEINLKRVPRLLVNAYEAGGASKLSAAVGRTILMSRIAWMYGALWAWNMLIQGGDEEDELTGEDRAVPHVILGRNPDGSIRVFRRVGALGDFLEWFGINEAMAMLGKYKAGQVDAVDILKEMAFATPEKTMDSLRPDLKALYEIPTGQSLFPEPFQPRSVRRDEASAGIFGLEDEYKWMKGWTLGDGSTARPHYWQRWLYGVVDPRQSALSEIYDLRSDFLKKKGKEEKGAFPVSRYKEARDSAKSEDYGAFTAWKRKFVEDKGEKAKDDFKDWLGTLDPIASRLNDSDELEFETTFLTKEQRGRLAVARNYSHELRDLLVTWWDADEKSQVMKRAVLFSAFERMDASKPKRKDFKSDELFETAKTAFTKDNERSAEEIKSMADSLEEARTLLREYYRRPNSQGKRGSLTEGYYQKQRALSRMWE
jgi:hypothetical protein